MEFLKIFLIAFCGGITTLAIHSNINWFMGDGDTIYSVAESNPTTPVASAIESSSSAEVKTVQAVAESLQYVLEAVGDQEICVRALRATCAVYGVSPVTLPPDIIQGLQKLDDRQQAIIGVLARADMLPPVNKPEQPPAVVKATGTGDTS